MVKPTILNVDDYEPARYARTKMLRDWRSEEHTSELQSRLHLVCRLLLEKKKIEQTQQSMCPHVIPSKIFIRFTRLVPRPLPLLFSFLRSAQRPAPATHLLPHR